MSKTVMGRHRAPGPATTPLTGLSAAVKVHSGAVGRSTATIAAAAGITVMMGLPASATEHDHAPDTHTSAGSTSVASSTVASSESTAVAPSTTADPSGSTTADPSGSTAVAGGPATYTVRAGDTLSKIARAHNVSGGWRALYSANKDVVSDPARIYVGQKLQLSGSTSSGNEAGHNASANTGSASGTYTVRAGDTLSKIASAQNVSGGWRALYSANKDVLSSPAQIYVGQKLQLSGSSDSSGGTSSTAAHAASDGGHSTTSSASSSTGSSIVSIAQNYVGAPYVWGGSTPSGWDCSGYVSYVYAKAGISVPHSSGAIRSAGHVIPASQARPGDIIWSPGHVGIYAGNGQMYDAGNPRVGTSKRSYSWISNPTFLRF